MLLLCALIGLVKNPYMTDFSQRIYLMAFFNLHYPSNLASLLESCQIAHLHGIIKLLTQNYAIGEGKFSYISDMGLLSNSAINLVIVVIGLVIFFIAFIVYQILKKVVNYNKI